MFNLLNGNCFWGFFEVAIADGWIAEETGYKNSLGLVPAAQAAEELGASSAKSKAKQIDFNYPVSDFPLPGTVSLFARTSQSDPVSQPYHGFHILRLKKK